MPSLITRSGVLRYRASVPIPNKKGKRKQKIFPDDSKRSYKAAILWEKGTLQRLQEEQEQADMVSISAGNWCDKYLDDVKKRYVKKTYEEKKTAFNYLFRYEHIEPCMSVCELAESRVSDTSLAYDFLNEQFELRGGNAANKDRKNLSKAWSWGQKYLGDFPRNLINPFHAVERFPAKSVPRYVPSEQDFWKVYDSVEDQQDKAMILAAYHLAARRGEIFRIKRPDIDFKSSKIRLWTRKRKGSDLEYDWLPLTSDLKKALLSWWGIRLSHVTVDKEHMFVCLTKSPFCEQYYGKPFTHRQHFMERNCIKAKVKLFGFHAIRHLSATVQYHKGKQLDWLQRFLRHQSPTTTQRYLKSLGLEPLREGLEEGFKRPCEIVEFKKKASERISSRG